MSYNERTNLLFILIAILAFIYFFFDSSENFETYKYKCGDKFKYQDKSSANGKCPMECPVLNLGKNSEGTYEFKCEYYQNVVDDLNAKKVEEYKKAEKEAQAAMKKIEEYTKAEVEAAMRKAEAQVALKKAQQQLAMKKEEAEAAIRKEEAQVAMKKAETDAAMKKVEEHKKTEALSAKKKAEAQEELKKAQEVMARNVQYKPIIEQEY